MQRVIIGFSSFIFSFFVTALAFAADIVGAPHEKQLSFQAAASPVMEKITSFHDFLLVLITIVATFVLALLLWVMVRYNARRNPVPSKTTHNTMLEVVWTLIPVLILLIIIVPSMRLLYFSDKAVNAEMTLKAIGKQWFWTYEYPDNGNFTFDAYILKDEEAKAAGHPRLLGTDNLVVLPTETNIRILVTGADVLHAWAMPSLGVKKDAVPGKINETWLRIEKPGMYYGQCSELCGTNHGFMPIALKAVPKAEFEAWVKEAKAKFPVAEGTPEAETKQSAAPAAH
ncbi:MAG: cytochrome c oxidase subunit II [Alphaproteobacteria bacterium]|nr:MAG: cytochrome c oxidase subunit II [Alphaproteobacteria bacterium]